MERTIKKLLIIGALSLFCVSAFAVTVPNKFTANTPAVAAEVNENFSVLEAAINSGGGSVVITPRTVIENTGVGSMDCLSNETIVSAGCYCSGNPDTGTNIGILFVCSTVNNSAVGGCFPYVDFQENRSIPIQVTAMCASNSTDSRQADSKLGNYSEEALFDLEVEQVVEGLREQAAAVGGQISNGE